MLTTIAIAVAAAAGCCVGFFLGVICGATVLEPYDPDRGY